MKSPLYTEELIISGNKILKARAFHPVRLPSVVATAYYSQSLPVAEVIYYNAPAKNRIGAGEEKTLIDLVRARPVASDENWQGFEGDELQVVLDLGDKKDVYELEISLLEDNNAGIFLPAAVKLSCLWMEKSLKL